MTYLESIEAEVLHNIAESPSITDLSLCGSGP